MKHETHLKNLFKYTLPITAISNASLQQYLPMKKVLILLALHLLAASCENENDKGNFIVKGNIDGLKVGNVLLQKIKDSTLVTIDSVALDGVSEFELSALLNEPQLLYVHLDVKDGTKYDDRIMIFAEEGTMTVHSDLKNFEENAKVKGSKNDSVLRLFLKNKKRLDAAYTELVKRGITISQEEEPSPIELNKLDTDYENHLRKRILFAINFARINKELEVAPYLLVSEAFDANPKLLDSTFNLMPQKIQNSRYGKELSGLIELSKKENGL